jgi:hypothetical protein
MLLQAASVTVPAQVRTAECWARAGQQTIEKLLKDRLATRASFPVLLLFARSQDASVRYSGVFDLVAELFGYGAWDRVRSAEIHGHDGLSRASTALCFRRLLPRRMSPCFR